MAILLRPEDIPEFHDLAQEFRASERGIIAELKKVADKGDEKFLFSHLSPEARSYFMPMMAK
jgi:hypothetical protein